MSYEDLDGKINNYFHEVNSKLNELDRKWNSLEAQLHQMRDMVAPMPSQVNRLIMQYPEDAAPFVKAEPDSSGLINLNNYKANGRFSQGGEEGILKQLYEYIEPTGYVVEFGAADGLFCSNTAHIWTDGKTEALLIESDDKFWPSLCENTEDYPNVTPLQALVENIDHYVSKVADVMSIDIDGYDYTVASKMAIEHQIVAIEYNPTVPPHVDMVPRRNLQGCGAKSLVSLMEGKGYTLVACTKTNLFFLYGDHKDKFESRLEVLFDYSSLNYVVTTYDGLYEMIGEGGYGMEQYADLGLIGREQDSCRRAARIDS